MADGKVIIDASLDTSDIRRDVQAVNRELGNIGDTMPKQATTITNEVGERFDSLGRRIRDVYKGTSPEAQRMSAEIRSAFAQQRVAMNGLRDDMIGVQYGYFQMAKGAKDYTGTNQEFMDGIETLGKKHKKINDQMMASNDMQRMNFYQSVGSMLARSTQASKISDNFDRMNNPLYKVNNGLLNVADGMNKIAQRGQPAAVALRMLGPSANMKQLQDMTTMITQGLMRFTMVAIIAAAGAAIFYKAMHDGAMSTNAAYAEAFSGMLSSVREAFQPMIDVFAMVMTPVWNFIKAIADMIIKFNEAHPTLAKIISGFLLLIPALTLILSPLAIGIGLFGGLSAAMGAMWVVIGPVVTGFAAMMGTVLLVAAAITALVVIGVLLYKNWDTIAAYASNLWSKIKSYFLTGVEAIKTYVVNGFNSMIAWIVSAWSRLTTAFSVGIAIAKAVIVAGFTAAINWVKSSWQSVVSFFVGLWSTVKNVFSVALAGVVSFVTSKFGYLITATQTIFSNYINIFKNVWNIIKNVFLGALLMLVNLVTGDFGKMRSQAVQIMNNIRSSLSSIWSSIKTMASTAIKAMVQTVIQLFQSLKSTAVSLVNALKTAISNSFNATKSAAVNSVNALKNGAVNAYNALKSGAINAVNSLKAGVVNGFNSAKSSAVSSINALKNGAVNAFRNMVSSITSAMSSVKSSIVNGWNAAKSFLSSIDLTSIGKNIIQGLVNGIKSMVGAIGEAVTSVANKVKDGITGLLGIHSPSRWMRDNVGKMIPAGVGVGIEANTGAATKALSGMTKDMMLNAPRQMAANISARQPSPAMATGGGSQVINLNIDGKQVGQVIVPTVNRMQERQRSFKAFNKGVR